MARLIKENNILQRRNLNTSRIYAPHVHPNPAASNPRLLGPSPLAQPAAPIARCLSAQEARKQREKGLCFYCDDKFVPGHCCVRPQHFMIKDVFDLSTEENGQVNSEEKESATMPKISFHAISGG